jgi:hypothetical protein
MDSGSTPQEEYVLSPQPAEEDCDVLSPTLADILSDDRILRFYQCVKDIKTQNSPNQTAAMFFALCHALGDTVSFLKVPNMSKIMFRQDQQIFAVNVAGTQQDSVQNFQPPSTSTQPVQFDTMGLMHDVDSSHNSNLFTADASDGSPQQLLQAALASVASHVEQQQQTIPESSSKRKVATNKEGTTKKYKKSSPRDKQYAVRRKDRII